MGKVRCPACKKEIESTSRHDFQFCGCPAKTFVDGGDDYLRFGGRDIDDIELWDDKTEKWIRAGDELDDENKEKLNMEED